jgi:hypothetical protein
MNEIESEWAIERSKVVARWFGIVVLATVLEWQRHNGLIAMPRSVFLTLVGGMALINLLHTVYLARCRTVSPLFKYLTTGLDALLVTVTIAWTGYTRSPFFYVYFVLLVSNCLRYGFGMALYLATLVNILYAGALSLAPMTERQTAVLGGEGLKILGFWAVALYGGSIAARMRRTAHVIAAYEDTIAELRAELRARDARAGTAGETGNGE